MQMNCGRAPAFSGSGRLMQRPELVQRSEDGGGEARGGRGVARGRRREGKGEMKGGMFHTIYKEKGNRWA